MLSDNEILKDENQQNVSFSVDAGIINRLGKELVGRAETAVSELVKNAYDADATLVQLDFINTNIEGGTLQIIDNGHGMTREQLINGFMRLSSSDKFHNPVSPLYQRLRAGKKGIGRFATQRLGLQLVIITKAKHEKLGHKLEVNWDKYIVDTDLNSIKNPISDIQVDFEHGTKLIISSLRESWITAPIKRVYRYISDLLQPSFLSDSSADLNIKDKDLDGGFNVKFVKSEEGVSNIVADLDTMVFDHALGMIEGYVLNSQGICEVISKRFEINDQIEVEGNFSFLDNVHFKVYYFIYNYKWYEGFIPKMDFNKISELGSENGGIKLYRNGFRVLPYGERGNDWINIDKTSIKTQDNAYVPFNNPNFFGFVEVIDKEGENFEETSSREGLIENEAFKQLTDFVNKSLRQASQRINSARLKEKKSENSDIGNGNSSNDSSNPSTSQTTTEKLEKLRDGKGSTEAIINEVIKSIEEVEMLRVLAGIGLNIAEFTHEIRQFIPAFNGSINYLLTQDLPEAGKLSLINLKENFNRFKTYTAYIDYTITENANREKYPIDIRKAVRSFHNIILKDILSENLLFNEEYYGFDLYTYPMHPSEWTSILYNLYTNSKKAIKRLKPNQGLIQIIAGQENDKIYLEFMDNGDGVPENNKNRIFDAFFTTSTPKSLDVSTNEAATGTGLGLKIVKDIIQAYGGKIYLVTPEENYTTNFRIELPKASAVQIENYGY